MTLLNRVFPTLDTTRILRGTVLGVAGLAFTGGVIAGPATAAHAAPADRPVSVLQQAGKPGGDNSVNKDNPGRADKAGGKDNPGRADKAGGKELPVRYQAQPNFFYCGPAAVRNALSANGHELNMDELAKQMGTTEAGTNSANETTAALNKVLGAERYHTVEIPGPAADAGQVDKLTADVRRVVDDGRAVVVNIAGSATDVDGATHSFPGGHYLAVVGYTDDGKKVKIADSADPNTASYWMHTTDLANWIATRGYSA